MTTRGRDSEPALQSTLNAIDDPQLRNTEGIMRALTSFLAMASLVAVLPDVSGQQPRPQDYRPEVQGRIATFLGLKLFVIEARPIDREKEQTLIQDHLSYQVDLEERGIMFAAGPLRNEQGERLAGLIVIRADSFTDAKRIADEDPMHRMGAREYSIREWTVNEGGFDLKVRFSDQSVVIE